MTTGNANRSDYSPLRQSLCRHPSMPWAGSAMLSIALLAALGGCSMLSVRASCPCEPLTTENAHRLRFHANKEVPEPIIRILAVDPLRTVATAAIDSDTNRLLVLRAMFSEWEKVGVYAYDLDTLWKTDYQPIPSIRGGFDRWTTWRSALFDTSTGYLVLGSWAGLQPTGNLTLIRTMPARRTTLAANPIADSDYILYRETEAPWRDRGVFYVNRNTLTVDRHGVLPPVNRDALIPPVDREIVIQGAIGHTVLARGRVGERLRRADSYQLIVFEAADDEMLKETRVLDLGDYRPGTNAVDHVRGWWAVSESAWRPNNAHQKRLRIYEIPSLRVLHEFPEEYFCGWPQGMAFVPSAPILLIHPELESRKLFVLDADSGKILTKLPLGDASRPFTDSQGCWIGVAGYTSITLFRVGDG